jgi:hypothetical protein
MQIIRMKKFKRCEDGSVMKEYLVDCAVTREHVSNLSGFGTVKVMENLKQPFFSCSRQGFFTIKGMVGDTTLMSGSRMHIWKSPMNCFHPYSHSGLRNCSLAPHRDLFQIAFYTIAGTYYSQL